MDAPTPSSVIAADAPAGASPSDMLAVLARLSSVRFSSINDAFETTLRIMAQLVGVRSAFVAQLTSESMEVLGAWDDNGCGIRSGGTEPLEETFCQYVRATGAPVVIPQAAEDPRVRNVATRVAYQIGAYVGVPLTVADGSLFGTLCLLDPEPREFTSDQVHMLTIVGHHLAHLIERELMHKSARRQEHQNEQQLSSARSVVEEQCMLLQAVAHDLRAPLTSIRGYTDLIESEMLGPVPPIQKQNLRQIANSAMFMNRLVTDLVDAARAEKQGLMIISSPYGPGEIAQRVVGMYRQQAQEQHLSLELREPPGLPEAIGDAARVEQILLNLVGNALRYTKSGHVLVSLYTDRDWLEYCVEDTGPGIAPDVQQRIWEPHTRGVQDNKGLGLGLYIVKRLANALGGDVCVNSALGQGSCFRVRLPLRLDRPRRAELV